MPDEQNIQRIVAYIAQNRAAYSLDALRAQLLAAGYSADDVDAAIARSDQPLPTSSAPEAPSVPEIPAAPAGDNANRERRMVEYLRQNGQTYNLNALRRQLITQGEPPELVDAAIARVRTELPPAREGVVVPALPWAGGALVVALIAAWVSLIDGFDWVGFSFIAILYCGGLGALLVIVGAVVQAFRRRAGLAILFGGLFALAFAVLGVVIFFGVCLVLISQGGF